MCVFVFCEITLRGGSGCIFYGARVLLLWQTTVRLSDETPPDTFVCVRHCLAHKIVFIVAFLFVSHTHAHNAGA